MCGIAGVFVKKKIDNVEYESAIMNMSQHLYHRGPDSCGLWKDDGVYLAHRRLSIIDISDNSNQPMVSTDGRFIIVFNGEIYNYIEIRDELVSRNIKFRTQGDTEVVLEAYRYYGPDCFNLFNGMWAMAIYDIKEKKLVLSRDRFGVKPLYVVDDENCFVFSSEMGAILDSFPQYRIINPQGVYNYLADGVNEDSDETTFYKYIKSFPAANYLVADFNNNTSFNKRYWNIDIDSFRKKWINGKNPYKTLRELFESSVSLRLRSDVEVGVCLSGGLDSSAILGCASSLRTNPIQTFSSIYEDEDCNEEKYIEDVNKMWNTVPHYVKPDQDEKEFVNHLKEIIYHHGQPVNGASLFSQYKVMQMAGNNVKVVLDGQGADELFGGYLYYYSFYIKDLADRISFASRFKLIKEMVILRKYWPDMMQSISADDIIQAVGLKNSHCFIDQKRMELAKRESDLAFYSKDFLAGINRVNSKEELPWMLSSNLNTKLCRDLVKDSIPSLLHNEDGNSMTFSVESRVPFLDYRIVEFSLALDGEYKIKNGWTKRIMRKSLKKYLPKSVIKRRNKMGFPAPFARWLRTGDGKEEYKKLIYAFARRNVVPEKTIDVIYNSHIKGEADYSELLFRYMCLEIWYQMMETTE